MKTGNAAETQLRRLIAIDAALASREGMRRDAMAAKLGVSRKTVVRLETALHRLGFETEAARMEADDGTPYYVHRYVDRRRRLFSRAVSELTTE